MIVTINETLFQGFLPDVFTWMQRTATEQLVPESGRHGGLIFDEMSIQRDIQLDSRDGHSRLSCTVDLGGHGNDFDKFIGVDESKGKNNKCVSFSFSTNGILRVHWFRVPLCSFPYSGCTSTPSGVVVLAGS